MGYQYSGGSMLATSINLNSFRPPVFAKKIVAESYWIYTGQGLTNSMTHWLVFTQRGHSIRSKQVGLLITA